MSVITLPKKGEAYLGDSPQPVRIAKCDLAFSGGDVDTGAVQATYPLFNIPANSLVLEVLCYTPTGWTTSVTIDIGDGDDTNGWLATAKVAPTSAQTNGIVKSTDVATAEAYSGGKLYLTADTIDAVVGGANPAAGHTVVLVKYIPDYSVA